MLELVKQIIEKQMFNEKDILTSVEIFDVDKLRVASTNASHLQDLLASVISNKDVVLREFSRSSKIKGMKSEFVIAVY